MRGTIRVLNAEERATARMYYEQRARTWHPDLWDYTEWEELYEEIRGALKIHYPQIINLDFLTKENSNEGH